MTHSSYANERNAGAENNERLEFLGDAVLELTVSEELFRRFPEVREGELTRMRSRLVSQPTLAQLAREMGLHEHLRLGRGEESQGGRNRDSLLSDAVEALIGAIFLDAGFDAAKEWVIDMLHSRWPKRPETSRIKDYKSRLQEATQQLYKARPLYALAGSAGPEHEKQFLVLLTMPDGREITAQGPSVKKAEQLAADKALRLLDEDAEKTQK